MTNMKATKRALVSSVLALVLCFAMLLGTTYAWFTDSVVSANNKITAGTLDVELWHHTEGGKTNVYEDWTVKEVKRSDDGFNSFVVTYTSESAKDQTWSTNSTVMIEIFDEAGSEYAPVVIRFKVSEYSKFIWETVKFEQVK